MSKKILHREVQEIHNAWARAMQQWGENNLDTIRKLGKYQDARRQYESDHGKPFEPKA